MPPKAKVTLDLPTLAAELEASRRPNGFDLMPYEQIEAILLTTFPFQPGLAELERRKALHRGISAAAAQGPITPQSLESGIRREERLILGEPTRRFIFASSLSFTRYGAQRDQQFHAAVRVVRSLPSTIRLARADDEAHIPTEDQIVSGYTGVLVRVDARSPHHAFDVAIQKLDLVRGLWNFGHNRHRVWGSTTNPTQPINRVRLGRVHTIHEANGTLATKSYWFNPEFQKEGSTYLSDAEWNRMQRFLRSAQQHLSRVSYRNEVERAIIHYSRALDAMEMEAAFLKLWSVFEFISGLGGERYDTLIARAEFLFKPDRITSLALQHLRYQRNEAVHLGTPQEEMRPLVYQLKFYVERMIAFHIALGRHFKDLEEAGRFMDLNQSPATLRRKVEMIERALKYRQVRAPRKTQKKRR